MTVVEWETDTVEPKAREESSTRTLEECLKDITPELSFIRKKALAGIPDRRNTFPMVSARASRIWNSHPGYPEQIVKIRRGGRPVFHERLAADEVLHAARVGPES